MWNREINTVLGVALSIVIALMLLYICFGLFHSYFKQLKSARSDYEIEGKNPDEIAETYKIDAWFDTYLNIKLFMSDLKIAYYN